MQADWTHQLLSVAWFLGSLHSHQQVDNVHDRAAYTSFYHAWKRMNSALSLQSQNILTHRSKHSCTVYRCKLYPIHDKYGIPFCHYICHFSGVHNNLVTVQPLLKQEKSTSAWIPLVFLVTLGTISTVFAFLWNYVYEIKFMKWLQS